MQPIWMEGLVGAQAGEITWSQMSLRAAVVFVFGLALVRLAGKRVFGKWGAIDIILSVIIGSNLSRALTGNAPLVETLVATALLVVLHGLLTALAVRIPALGPLIKGSPARLVRDGQVDDRALKRHGVGPNDLAEALRCAGVGDVADVSEAWVERNGQISVLTQPKSERTQGSRSERSWL